MGLISVVLDSSVCVNRRLTSILLIWCRSNMSSLTYSENSSAQGGMGQSYHPGKGGWLVWGARKEEKTRKLLFGFRERLADMATRN